MVEENEMSIPHLFRCPISLDLFTDPVTLSTGHTYDRQSIEKWFISGHSTCPITMQRLEDTSLVPNHMLRQFIDQWLLHDIVDPHWTFFSTDFAASLVVVRSNLQSSDTPLAGKLEALKKTRILSVESSIGKSELIRLGFFPVLLQLVFGSQEEGRNVELVELALDCILSLSPSNHLNSLNFLKQDEAFYSLVVLLEEGNAKVRTSLCLLLETIASSPATHDVGKLLGKSRRVVQVLVSLLGSASCEQAAEAAAGAVAAICAAEENRGSAIRDGAVQALVSYLSTGARRNASSALAAVEALMESEAGRREAVNGEAVRVMVRWVFRMSSMRGESERAIGALLAVCRGSGKARKEAAAAGAMTQLLLLLQSQCTVEAKRRAMVLLKLLSSMGSKENKARK